MGIKTEVLRVSQEPPGGQCNQSSVNSRRMGCRAHVDLCAIIRVLDFLLSEVGKHWRFLRRGVT